MSIDSDILIKIGLAILVGGLVGAEREYRDKAAGFRTMIFISLGAMLFTWFSITIGVTRDQARIAAAIVSGVGFLGGGAIMRDGTSIQGLTTAATIWLVAALGMGVGAGYYQVALPATAAVLVVLWFFPFIEKWIDNLKTSRTYEAICSEDGTREIEAIFRDAGLVASPGSCFKKGDKFTFRWHVTGAPAGHNQAVARIIGSRHVDQLTY